MALAAPKPDSQANSIVVMKNLVFTISPTRYTLVIEDSLHITVQGNKTYSKKLYRYFSICLEFKLMI